jgi:hypothetical protein
MWVVLELPAPSMEDGHPTQLSPEMLGITGDVKEGLRHGAKKQAIEQTRIVQDERAEVLRQGKNRVLVGRIKNFALSVGEPSRLGRQVTFWATAMPARVIRLLLVAAVVALREMPTEGSGTAQLDSPESSTLRATERVPIAIEESLAMLAYHISDFKPWATHGR